MMAFLLLFSHGSPQTLHTVTTVPSLVWNQCSEIMIRKLLLLPFPASRIRSSHSMAGLNKTSPCQLGFLPQVCQLLTIYMCTILLPGRALSKAAKSPAQDTKPGPGRDCASSPGPDPCRTWRELWSLRKGSKPTGDSGQEEEKRRTNLFFLPSFFQHPNLLRLPQQAPPPRVISCAFRLWIAKFTFA